MPANPGLKTLADASLAAGEALGVKPRADLLASVGPLVSAQAAAMTAVAPTARLDLPRLLDGLAWADEVRGQAEDLLGADFAELAPDAVRMRDTAGALAGVPAPGDKAATPDGVARAVSHVSAWPQVADHGALILDALRLQPRPASALPLPVAPTFPDLPTAVDAFLRSHGAPPLDAASQAAAAAVAEPSASGLVRIIEAAMVMEAAADIALVTDGLPDVGLLLATRDMAAARIAVAIPLLAPGEDLLDIPPLIRINLADSDDTYTSDYALLIDRGGNDTYRNNGGGGKIEAIVPTAPAAGPAGAASALLVDVAGDDQYLGRAGLQAVNGAGHGGTGFLWDAAGNDTYATAGAFLAANGAAIAGIGTLVDGAGDDRYEATVDNGAANGAGSVGAGALIDAHPTGGKGGADSYLASSAGYLAANGGAFDRGTGFLVDSGGDDDYNATAGTHGGLNGGATRSAAGWLLDAGGNDSYHATIGEWGAANGGAWQAAGHVVDLSGSDHYRASLGEGAGNGAGILGPGLLADGDGDDIYETVLGGRGAGNGGGDLGSGLLVDGGGNDRYNVTSQGAGQGNGGAILGSGLLIDHGGNDHYEGSIDAYGSLNGASEFSGIGCLLDLSGRDHYDGRVLGAGGVNGGTRNGWSLLLDMEYGRDAYNGSVGLAGGVNGGATIGLAILDDQGGNNTFQGIAPQGAVQGSASSEPLVAGDEARGQGASTPGAASLREAQGAVPDPGPVSVPDQDTLRALRALPAAMPSVGILLAGDGDDTYAGSGTAQGAGDFYGLGILVDTGGRNVYTLESGLGQGAGRAFGVGMLLDGGSDTTFELGPGAIGQAAGLQGIGLLARTAAQSQTHYVAAPASQPTANTGGGASLLLDRTVADAIGPGPDFTCPGDLLRTLDHGDEKLILCAPSNDRQEPILNPTTGEPMQPVSKPAHSPCTPQQACQALSDLVTGPSGPAWLERDHINMTTGGGLIRVEGRGTTATVTVVIAANLDGSCDWTCFSSAVMRCVISATDSNILACLRNVPPPSLAAPTIPLSTTTTDLETVLNL